MDLKLAQNPLMRAVVQRYFDCSSSWINWLRSYQWKSADLTLAIVGVCTLWFLRSVLFTTRRFFNDQYPPGPKAIPFFGNALQLSMDAWVSFTKWKKQYGPLVYLNVMGQPLVILNNHKVATELLEKRSHIYSDRPRFIVADYLTGKNFFILMSYTSLWRKMRRASHEALLGPAMATQHRRIQFSEAVLMTEGFLESPQSFRAHLYRASASMIMKTIYDTPTIETENDASLKNINSHGLRIQYAVFPGAYLVENFKWMRFLPSWMAKWKREALMWYEKDSIEFLKLYNNVKERVLKGDERPSFVSSLISQGDKHGLTDLQSAWLASANYLAGADTTAGAMEWLVLAMISFPDVQKRAQAELDEVVGRDRLPTFSDYEHLHYIRAIIQEIARWWPVTPLGVSHRVAQDDEYDGYHIPKDTLVIPNVWAINHDPDVYGPDADEFNPSRHLDESGKIESINLDMKEDNHATFGYGRRACPGRLIASNTMYIDTAMLLWALIIEPANDEQGQPILPDSNSSNNTGIVVRPVPFGIRTRQRFPEVNSILSEAKEDPGD